MRTNSKSLDVYWGAKFVGTLSSDEQDLLSFAYAASWISENGPPLSLSMPLRKEAYQKESRTFFGNLLPEGDFRRRIEQLVRVSTDNDFSLLKEIGGDCAGALTLGKEGNDDQEAFYEPLSAADLGRIVRSEGIAGLGTVGQLNRLSLAGAQGKLPVRMRADTLEIPHKGAASTHILKFNRQSGEYPRLVENEYYMNRLAFHLGLPVVKSQLRKTPEGTILIVERYDRTHDAWPQRFHQEDFCQALVVSQHIKYEKEGGPSFAHCMQLARQHLGILDVNRLLEWFLFNLLLGNSDAHAKNISIIHGGNRAYSLAPFYDLVCTRAYERLDRKLAMACAHEFDPDLVEGEHLKTMARAIGVTPRLVNQKIKQYFDRIPKAMELAQADFMQQGFAKNEMQNVEQTQLKILKGFRRKFI